MRVTRAAGVLVLMWACGGQPLTTRSESAVAKDAAGFGDGVSAPVPPRAEVSAPVPDSAAPEPAQAQAGLLTAGAWDDNRNFSWFKTFDSTFSQEGRLPAVFARRLWVTLKDGAGAPVSGATVTLSAGQTILDATTSGGEGLVAFFPAWHAAPVDAELTVTATLGDETVSVTVAADADSAALTLAAEATAPPSLDLAFVIDTTGSMGDELSYLKAEVASIAERVAMAFPAVTQRYALVVYRDEGDAYLTRKTDFTTLAAFSAELGAQVASGGGDWPEAVDAGLNELSTLAWSPGNSARVAFWIADAPHHIGDEQAVEAALRAQRSKGVHLYPVASSGVDGLAEHTMRAAALATGGRYLFLTDDSGIGNSHAEPHIPCYWVTTLSAQLSRMLRIELGGAYLEPNSEDILRTVGNMNGGQCETQSGGIVTAL